MALISGKRIAILAEEGFENSELTEPMKAMREVGTQVVVVGSGSKNIYR